MGRRVASAPLESKVRAQRLRAGLSQGELAVRAGLTRQAVGAIESERYVPNTTVALRLARVLGCRVEELFALADALVEREVDVVSRVHLGVGASHQAEHGHYTKSSAEWPARTVVVRARGRWLAHPLTARHGLQEGFTGADALLSAGWGTGPRRNGQARRTARLLLDEDRLVRTALLLGCDPSLGILTAHLGRMAPGEAAGRVVWLQAGSQQALDAIAGGTTHLAGSHLHDPATGDFNLSQARRALAATGGLVVAFARWEQGLVVHRGNPHGLHSAADLAREGVRLINREPGTGSRTLLDTLLGHAGVPVAAVAGYDRTVSSHFEVACVVASGGADAGIALPAAAEAYGLDFVPLAAARFDLIIPADFLDHPAVALLLEALQSRALRAELRALPGYDVEDMGTVRMEVPSAA